LFSNFPQSIIDLCYSPIVYCRINEDEHTLGLDRLPKRAKTRVKDKQLQIDTRERDGKAIDSKLSVSSTRMALASLLMDHFSAKKEMVTIVVTEPAKTTQFIVHQAFLTHYSPIYKAMFAGTFIENETKIVNLDNVSSTVIDIFVRWIYTQSVVDADGHVPAVNHLLDLWMYGDMVNIPKLQNEVLDSMEDRLSDLDILPAASIRAIYDNTTTGSQLRKYISAVCACARIKEASVMKAADAYPPDLLIDMINYTTKHRKDKAGKFSRVDLKQFHVAQEFKIQEKVSASAPTVNATLMLC
jgi:hypothetical protein